MKCVSDSHFSDLLLQGWEPCVGRDALSAEPSPGGEELTPVELNDKVAA